MKQRYFAALALLALAGLAQAKLPPLTEEQKAAAAATKDKQAWTDKTMAYKLCLAQDRIAAAYLKKTGGKPSTEVPACVNPGPYVAQVAAAKEVGIADSKPSPEAGARQPPPGKK